LEEKYLIWHVQGGLGKNVAATALCQDIKEKYPDRKFILVCSWPEIFLNNSYIDKVYGLHNLSYFYENYIENKDVIIFKQEPYEQTGHITKKKHLIENWCDILNISYQNQQPTIPINYSQQQLILKWKRDKPILLLQTNGGPLFLNSNPTENILPYHWTRDIPQELSQAIVSKYFNNYHIIHVTRQGGYTLENVERLDYEVSSMELLALVASSQKRILIDSCLQHMAASLSLISNVIWIGTNPTSFGYSLHNNILSKQPKNLHQLINSYLFDYNFSNNTHECPYTNVTEIFDIPQVLNHLGN